MIDQIASSHSTMDPYEYLQMVLNPDGTITRNLMFPNTEATPDPVNDVVVLSKDVVVNPLNNTWLRMYLPRQALDSASSNKLPLVFYIHGGGFVLFSVATSLSHAFCSDLALEFPSVVVSLEYRLAPEHRLPAAYDDAMGALHWIKTTQEEWLTNYADLSCCFLMGTSAVGNIAYHAGLHAAQEVEDLLPLKIRGLILHSPFFSGAKRTESELRLVNDIHLPGCANDMMWELALPTGADRDHEYCNPTVGGGSKLLDGIRLLGWKVMVTGVDGDPLIDRQIELVQIMEQKGVQVVSHFVEGGYHCVENIDPSKTKPFILILKDFVLSSTRAD